MLLWDLASPTQPFHYCRLKKTFPHYVIPLLGSPPPAKTQSAFLAPLVNAIVSQILPGKCCSPPFPAVKGHPSPSHWLLSRTTNCIHNGRAQAEFPWEYDIFQDLTIKHHLCTASHLFTLSVKLLPHALEKWVIFTISYALTFSVPWLNLQFFTITWNIYSLNSNTTLWRKNTKK